MGKLFEVATVDEVPPGTAIVVEADGAEIALVNADGAFYALENECPHEGGSLGDGELIEDHVLECPRHRSPFDITTGEPLGEPAESPVRTYAVHVTGDVIKVEID